MYGESDEASRRSLRPNHKYIIPSILIISSLFSFNITLTGGGETEITWLSLLLQMVLCGRGNALPICASGLDQEGKYETDHPCHQVCSFWWHLLVPRENVQLVKTL